MIYRIYPPEEMLTDARVSLPLSKSISTRALVLGAYTGTEPDATTAAVCDDTRVIAQALTAWKASPNELLTVNVEASGAALRFLTAFFASQPGTQVTITGIERLCHRPMKVLVDALRSLGACIEYVNEDGFAPLKITGTKLQGGEIAIDSTISSQFISALIMAAPYMTDGLVLRLEGEPVSMPYINITLAMMEQRGIEAQREPLCISITPGEYKPFTQPAEGDWSAAAFWFEISALTAGWITITNLLPNSIQGDRVTAEYFRCLGVETGKPEDEDGNPLPDAEGIQLQPSPEVFGRLDLDLADTPDMVPALAVTCCLIGVPFKFTGLQNLSTKESDRLEAICTEMAKIGRIVERIGNHGLEWTGTTRLVMEMPTLDAHGDHRMAMALAPVAAYIPGILVSGVEYVTKSYPEYWEHLRSVGFTLEEVEN